MAIDLVIRLKRFFMHEILIIVRDLCQLKRGPQDLPYSPPWLIALIAASVLVDLLIAMMTGVEDGVLSRSLFSTGFAIAVLYALLGMRNLRARFVQAAMALVSCAMVFSLLILPLALASGKLPLNPQQLSPLQVLLAWLSFAMIIWKFTVDAHILRHALNIPFFAAMLIAIMWSIVDLTLARLFFGVPP